MKCVVLAIVASLAVANGFVMQPSAFVARAAVSSPCDVLMASRMNTKREKFFRNLENAKRFRKSSWKPSFKGAKVEAQEDTALMATFFVATDASGEALESAPEPALVA